MIQILKYISILLALLIFTYLTGKLIRQSNDVKNKTFDLLVNIFVGLLFYISIYALYITSFKSIFIVVVPIAFFYIQSKNYYRHSNYNYEVLYSKKFIILFAVLLAILFTQLYLSNFFGNVYFYKIGLDSSFHIFTASNIAKTGIESPTAAFMQQFESGLTISPSPYHYIDIYVQGLLQGVFPFMLGIEIFNYILTPLLIFLSYLAMLSIINEFKNLNIFDYLLPFLLILLIGFVPIDVLGIGKYQFESQTLFERSRTAFSFLLFSMVFLFLTRKNYLSYFIILSTFPILNYFYLYFTIPIFILVQVIWFKHNSIDEKIAIKKGKIIYISSIVSIVTFYLYFNTTAKTSSTWLFDIISLKYLLASLKLFFVNGLVKFLYFIPIYSLLAYYIIKNPKGDFRILIFSTLALVTSIGLQAFGHIYFESFQFETYTFLPLLSLVFCVYYSQTQFNKPKSIITNTILIISIIPSIYYHITYKNIGEIKREYLDEIRRHKCFPFGVIGYIANLEESKFNKNPYFVHNSNILRAINNDSWAYGLDYNLEQCNIDTYNTNNNSYFKKYIEKNRINLTDSNKLQVQLEFLTYHKIKYALIDQQFISIIAGRFKSSFPITDSKALIELN